ncbi:MAG TPA: hypothetical protein VFE14_13085, partial [Micromonosporaceae bacterium]|nr:hypothetical protein [Micromonosporaceae bacterium]
MAALPRLSRARSGTTAGLRHRPLRPSTRIRRPTRSARIMRLVPSARIRRFVPAAWVRRFSPAA